MALFRNNKTFAGNFFDPMGLFRRGRGNIDSIPGIEFSGEVPFSAGQVGLGADALKELSERFRRQIGERSEGKGLVGFDPRRRELLRNEFLEDLGEQETEAERQLSSISSAQGLRGGVPVTEQGRLAKAFARSRASGLADIDIEDLAARRQDINTATAQQPQAVQLGAGIQQNRANFDLQRALAEADIPVVSPQSSGIGDLASAAGLIFALRGNPPSATGTNAAGSAGRAIQRSNRSFTPRLGFDDPDSVNRAFQLFRAGQSRF